MEFAFILRNSKTQKIVKLTLPTDMLGIVPNKGDGLTCPQLNPDSPKQEYGVEKVTRNYDFSNGTIGIVIAVEVS